MFFVIAVFNKWEKNVVLNIGRHGWEKLAEEAFVAEDFTWKHGPFAVYEENTLLKVYEIVCYYNC